MGARTGQLDTKGSKAFPRPARRVGAAVWPGVAACPADLDRTPRRPGWLSAGCPHGDVMSTRSGHLSLGEGARRRVAEAAGTADDSSHR